MTYMFELRFANVQEGSPEVKQLFAKNKTVSLWRNLTSYDDRADVLCRWRRRPWSRVLMLFGRWSRMEGSTFKHPTLWMASHDVKARSELEHKIISDEGF